MARRAGLDRAKVVQAAAELADSSGLEQLTLANVAARLKVRLPSLYNHVAGLPGLERELTLLARQKLLRELSRAAIGKSGDDALIAVARAYRAFAHAHPGLYPATLRAPTSEDDELATVSNELVVIVLAVIESYGLEGDPALHAVRGLRSLLHGFVALEAAGGFGLPLDLDQSFEQLLQVFIAGLRQKTIPA